MNTTLLQENYEKLVALGRRYFSASKRDEQEEKAYFAVLNMLYQNALADTGDKVNLVIGFDENEKPVCWQPEKENLFGFCPCGAGIYLYGLDIAFLDIALRYPKEKVQYFGLYGDGLPYTAIDAGQLLEYCTYLQAPDGIQRYDDTVNAIRACVAQRESMTAEELKAEPVIFINVADAHKWLGQDGFCKLLVEILPKAQQLKMAVCITDYIGCLEDEAMADVWRACKNTSYILMLRDHGRYAHADEDKIKNDPLLDGAGNFILEGEEQYPFAGAVFVSRGERKEIKFLVATIFKVLTRQP